LAFKVSGPRIPVPHVEIPQINAFPENSISIGFQSTDGFPRCLDPGFVFPTSRYLRKACFRRTRFPLASSRPMGFRGVWTLDSCFPRRDTSEKLVSGELDFHWFPVDQWGFEVFRPRIHVLHIGLPLLPSLRLTLGILAGNILLTRLQTDKHTHNHLFRKTLLSVEGICSSNQN
jgi:hypothetical protein